MKKLSTVLRSLLLIVLIGWLGIAQPAEAQQTVTLSGRVTAAAGNAVPGATVSLEDSGWVAQETDTNGDYRLSVPPGTYRLRVQPPHGPLIAQKIEELRLSTNTTRDFVLETGVTLSGQVTANGQLVPWAFRVRRERRGSGSRFQCGTHAVRSLQPGGACWGPITSTCISDDFLNPMLEGVAVPHDTVLNITLESGVLCWKARSWTTRGHSCVGRTGLCSPACRRAMGRHSVLRPRP